MASAAAFNFFHIPPVGRFTIADSRNWVRPPGAELGEDQQRSLQALRQLASMLGARLLIEESDTVAEAVAAVARRQHSTYILMGHGRPPRGLARLRTPLPQRLMELLPGVDVRIVADRRRPEGTPQ